MAIEASQLRIDLSEESRWRRTLSVTVPASVVRSEQDEIMRSLASRLNLPGFRAGKVPRSVLKKRYGPALRKETLDRVIGEAYREALQSRSLQPISEGEIQKIDWAEEDDDLSFDIVFDVRPEIELARVSGFTVRRPELDVGDDEVDKVLDRLREQNASWKPVEDGKPGAGDLVSVTVRRLEDGGPAGEPNEYELVLGEGDALPDVESAIYTLDPHETGDFQVTFPEDFPDPDRRGEEQKLRIRLESRKVRDLPELTDDFARSVGDFESLEALRERIEEDIRGEAREQQEQAVRQQLVDLVLEANPFEVPRSMVDRYLDNVFDISEDADPEEVQRAREEVRPRAERAVKRILAVERLAESQGLRATEDELDARVEEIAEKNDISPSEVYARFQKSGRLETLEREITERKVFEFLKEASEIVENES